MRDADTYGREEVRALHERRVGVEPKTIFVGGCSWEAGEEILPSFLFGVFGRMRGFALPVTAYPV